MNSPRIIPAIVRAFFSSFVEGIVEGSIKDVNEQVDMTPQKMKQLLLEHYEEVSKYLFNVCFNPLAIVSYPNAESLEKILRSELEAKRKALIAEGKNPEEASLDPQIMLQYACGGADMCELMIEEYRRNFYAILGGRVMSVEEFFDGIDVTAMPAKKGNISEQRAIRALVMTVKEGFQAGRKVVGAENKPMNQIYIYRLLEDNMQCLMQDAPVHVDDEADLNETFHSVCGSMENMNTMLEEVMRG